MEDILRSYLPALDMLLNKLGSAHVRYPEGLVYQQRLRENLDRVRRHGDQETLRHDRSVLLTEINILSLDTTGLSFNQMIMDGVRKHGQEALLQASASLSGELQSGPASIRDIS